MIDGTIVKVHCHGQSAKGGSKAVIPPKRSRLNQRDFDKEMYKWRHLIENFLCRLKDFKKIAMRAEKTDESFVANIYLAATHIHLR